MRLYLKKELEELEKLLIKLAGEGGVAVNSVDETRREEDGVVDNFTEGDEFPEERAGGARETEEKVPEEARQFVIKLLEKSWLYLIRPAKESRLFVIKLPEEARKLLSNHLSRLYARPLKEVEGPWVESRPH